MARFMVKASEYKNVCKAVNDRKLAELKKEIIEILKKQDEKEFKKAVDLFESQEMHYSHLEKSITGKWVEKAGYGVGTVRIWKGKKYKKIAPGKWARVFDKEGRGTNIAIGKLIAKVQKIDNVEDLMDFVMQNKQRFVDENGEDLPILNKLRAASDIRNEKLSGESSSYTYGVGEDTSRAKNEIFAGKDKITKEEADLHKVARKFSQMPTGELNKRKAQLERWIDNKTKSKRDHLNNTIWREKYQEELDAINDVLDKRGVKKTEKNKDNWIQDSKGNRLTVEEAKKRIKDQANQIKVFEELISERSKADGMRMEVAKRSLEEYNKDLMDKLSPEDRKELEDEISKPKDEKKEVPYGGVDKTDEGEGKEALSMADKINEVAEKGELKVGDATFKVDKKGKEWAVRTEIMNAIKCKDAIDNINKNFDKAAKKKLEEDLKDKLDKIKAKLPDVVKEGKLEENKKIVEERLKNYSQFGTTIDEVVEKYKKDLISKIENHVKDNQLFTSRNTDDIELLGDLEHQVELASFKGSGVFYTECKKLLEGYKEESEAGSEESDYVQKKRDAKEGYWSDEFKERNMNNIKQKIAAMKEDGASDKKIKAYLEETIETNTNDIPWRERAIEEGRIKGNQANDYRDTIQERTVRIENCKELLKEYETKVEKSLEETFLMDMYVEDEIKKLEEEQEEESLFDDYSAEQPGLFNSTAMKVQEAMNRCNIL
ncbi:MAG: hypothetical protein J6W16_07165 [Methanobrevibacter sp.]|nr:hypothetical protein [Methanobrevibacter sp.]MBP5785343.1 hypothetical protein [Methanobrevibacter sp.]